MSERADAVRMRGIAKHFGSVQALRGADFSCARGEIHALLGENGAGKSTLMQVLFGLVKRDAGTIELAGRPAVIDSPVDAMAAGIGMVHQHFTQVARMSVAENVALGGPGLRFDRGAAAELVRRVGRETGLALDPDTRAGDLPVGLRQRLEIVKALARDARVLILDEPSAALTPQEVNDLFAALGRVRSSGAAIVLITHKLREVLVLADRVTVLRRGAMVVTGEAGRFGAAELARAMIGDAAAPADLAEALEVATLDAPDVGARPAGPALEVRELRVRRPGTRRFAVEGVSLTVAAGEIVGIAAVEGNGQRELMRAVAGLLPHDGSVVVGCDGTVGFVPEDRHGEGLILDLTLSENLALGAAHGLWLDRRRFEHAAALATEEYGIHAGDATQPVRQLSGGNQQKVVLAREIARRPVLLVAENPTRGLDVHAMAEVHARLRAAARRDELGVLVYSTDLDEVLALADRVGVMVGGRWSWVPETSWTREAVGAMMLGAD